MAWLFFAAGTAQPTSKDFMTGLQEAKDKLSSDVIRQNDATLERR